MSLGWYIVYIPYGCEHKAINAIKKEAEKRGMLDSFGEMVAPIENRLELKRGKKVRTEKKVMPGYVLLQMEMSESAWGLVNRAFNMAKFLGANNKPAKVSEEEVQRIISKINDVVPITEEAERFELQDVVLIMDGPFQNFEGVIKEMNQEKFKLTVSVNILGRDADVNLDFDQVRKKDI